MKDTYKLKVEHPVLPKGVVFKVKFENVLGKEPVEPPDDEPSLLGRLGWLVLRRAVRKVVGKW